MTTEAKRVSAPRCTVCTHKDRILIDNLVSSGAEMRATARRFGLGRDAVRRHFDSHVSDAYKASVVAGSFGEEEDLRKILLVSRARTIERLDALFSGLQSRWLANVEAGADTAVVSLSKQMMDILDRITDAIQRYDKFAAPSPKPGE